MFELSPKRLTLWQTRRTNRPGVVVANCSYLPRTLVSGDFSSLSFSRRSSAHMSRPPPAMSRPPLVPAAEPDLPARLRALELSLSSARSAAARAESAAAAARAEVAELRAVFHVFSASVLAEVRGLGSAGGSVLSEEGGADELRAFERVVGAVGGREDGARRRDDGARRVFREGRWVDEGEDDEKRKMVFRDGRWVAAAGG